MLHTAPAAPFFAPGYMLPAPWPAVVEEALGWMSKGESAVYVLPAHLLAHQGGASSGTGLLPAPPAKCLQVEVHLELLSLVQVSGCCAGTWAWRCAACTAYIRACLMRRHAGHA